MRLGSPRSHLDGLLSGHLEVLDSGVTHSPVTVSTFAKDPREGGTGPADSVSPPLHGD